MSRCHEVAWLRLAVLYIHASSRQDHLLLQHVIVLDHMCCPRHDLYVVLCICMVRRHGQVAEALSWAQERLAPLRQKRPECEEELREVVALLAYGDPQVSKCCMRIGTCE